MTPPTVQYAALRLLPYLGITSLSAQTSSSELESVTDSILDDVATCLTGAMQEIWKETPSENREFPSGGLLHGATAVTLSLTHNSTVIGAFGSYASWMIGCTIKVSGDAQDNEIVSSGLLARPYAGPTAAGITATVYGDCIQLDDTIGHVIAPVELPNQWPLVPAVSRMDFMRYMGVPLVTNPDGTAYGYPFFWFSQKTVARPRAWWMEGFYFAASTPNFIPKRLRVAPLPDQDYPIAFRSSINPPRYTRDDINGASATITGTLIPDATGVYRRNGTFNGKPMFTSADGTRSLGYIEDDHWIIEDTTDLQEQVISHFTWSLASSSDTPAGTYPPDGIGNATGTATVAYPTDPGVYFPIPNGWVETILLPVARQHLTAHPGFKNESAKAEIARQYKLALAQLRESRAQVSVGSATYI